MHPLPAPAHRWSPCPYLTPVLAPISTCSHVSIVQPPPFGGRARTSSIRPLQQSLDWATEGIHERGSNPESPTTSELSRSVIFASMSRSDRLSYKFAGRPGYRDTEIHQGLPEYDGHVDAWLLGCIMAVPPIYGQGHSRQFHFQAPMMSQNQLQCKFPRNQNNPNSIPSPLRRAWPCRAKIFLDISFVNQEGSGQEAAAVSVASVTPGFPTSSDQWKLEALLLYFIVILCHFL
jgi:serine/threonine protein kinase